MPSEAAIDSRKAETRDRESRDAAAYPWLKSYPPNLDWHVRLTPRPLWHLLDDSAARYPTRIAVDFLGKTYSYAALKRMSDAVAFGLGRLGLQRGDRLGLFLPNTPYSVIFYYAALKLGLALVNFNPLYAPPEIAHQAADSQTETLVALDLAQFIDKLLPLFGASPLKRVIVCPMGGILPWGSRLLFWLMRRHELAAIPEDDRFIAYDSLLGDTQTIAPPAIDPEKELALLQYTGGTTGTPKGAMLSHANVYVNALQSAHWFSGLSAEGAEIGDEEEAGLRILGVLPLFHAFAMTCIMNWSLAVGGTMILMPRFEVRALLRTIALKRPMAMPAVPTIFTAINNTPGVEGYDLSSLRFCISGGAPLPTATRAAFARFSAARLIEGYGISEASPVTCCNPIETGGKAGSIGLPYPGTICEIVALDDRRTCLKTGEIGEICFRGPQVMLGYWQQPAATAEALVNGRLHTGDVGYMDADGYVFITGRIKDTINASGFKIYPSRIEDAIYLHPAVAECAVIGVSDPYRGQTVKAFVVVKKNQTLTEEALLDFLADKLSPIEMPRLIAFRPTLPKSDIGKILKRVLIEEETATTAAHIQSAKT